jgi:hypothetical protein
VCEHPAAWNYTVPPREWFIHEIREETGKYDHKNALPGEKSPIPNQTTGEQRNQCKEDVID